MITQPTHIWAAGSGRRLSLYLTLGDVQSCSHPGQCDADVNYLISLDRIQSQVNQWDPEILKAELGEYGAWDEAELADHGANVQRTVWIACCDVAENPEFAELAYD